MISNGAERRETTKKWLRKRAPWVLTLRKWIKGQKRYIPRKELRFEISLAEHCNLNCAGCNHFSPLAEPEFADFEESRRDFERLSELFHHQAERILLLGGEPLLNPEVPRFFQMAREYFPSAEIALTTNGVTLLKQPEQFWYAAKDNKIGIYVTKYPIPLDFEAMESKAKQYGISLQYFGGSEHNEQFYYVLDPEGNQKKIISFPLCGRANDCIYLQHGRLYTCTLAPTARHFIRYFDLDMQVSSEDSIDIYTAKSAKEILDFLARPIPFCRYCAPRKDRAGLWRRSQKDIKEWTL